MVMLGAAVYSASFNLPSGCNLLWFTEKHFTVIGTTITTGQSYLRTCVVCECVCVCV